MGTHPFWGDGFWVFWEELRSEMRWGSGSKLIMAPQQKLDVWPSSASNRFRYKHQRIQNRNGFLGHCIKQDDSLGSSLSLNSSFCLYFLKMLPYFWAVGIQLWTPEHAQTCCHTPSNPLQTTLHSINHYGCHTWLQGRLRDIQQQQRCESVWNCSLWFPLSFIYSYTSYPAVKENVLKKKKRFMDMLKKGGAK